MSDQFGYDSEPHADQPYEGWDDTPQVRHALPRWRLMLHDDEITDRPIIINAIVDCLPISKPAATLRVVEAYRRGTSQLLQTHRELAEHYYMLLSRRNLIVSIEPDEEGD